MQKTSVDDAYIPPLPDTHPAPWQWNINPAPVAKDDYRFPNRWKKISPFYPSVQTDHWVFLKSTVLDGTRGKIQSALTNYHSYKHATSFGWEQEFQFQDGYFQHPNYQGEDVFFINPNANANEIPTDDEEIIPLGSEKGDFEPAAPYDLTDIGMFRLEWGFFKDQQLEYGFQANTYFYWFSSNTLALTTELDVIAEGLKINQGFVIRNPNLKTIFECYNNEIVFKVFNSQTQSWFILGSHSFDWNEGYEAGFVQIYDLYDEVLGDFTSLLNAAMDYLHHIHLVKNQTPFLEPLDYISIITPSSSFDSGKHFLKITPHLPNEILVKYQQNGQDYSAYYDSSNNQWMATTTSSVPDFCWKVYSKNILESLETTFEPFSPAGEAGEVLVSVYPYLEICKNAQSQIEIFAFSDEEKNDTVNIRLELINEKSNEVIFVRDILVSTSDAYTFYFTNPDVGDYVLKVSSADSGLLFSTVHFSVRSCRGRVLLADRDLMAVGFASYAQADGDIVVSTSDSPNSFLEESGVYEKRRI